MANPFTTSFIIRVATRQTNAEPININWRNSPSQTISPSTLNSKKMTSIIGESSNQYMQYDHPRKTGEEIINLCKKAQGGKNQCDMYGQYDSFITPQSKERLIMTFGLVDTVKDNLPYSDNLIVYFNIGNYLLIIFLIDLAIHMPKPLKNYGSCPQCSTNITRQFSHS